MSRAATIALAFLIAFAGVLAPSVRAGAACDPSRATADAPCCGDDCRCGDDCACAVDEAPETPRDEIPAPPERSRGERTLVADAPSSGGAFVTLASPVDLGVFTRADSSPAAPPACRLRLALVSRWTT
ncbi:MAG: hypothetical protein GC172_02215 [Phycisphaera sp.]|nr:hypothetical protein [Phycisphaera sp.]